MSQLEQFMTDGPLPPSRHRRSWGKFVVAGLLVLAVVGMVLGGVNLLRGDESPTDYAGAGTGAATVVIAKGDTLTDIGGKLADAGVVLSSQAFVDAASVDDRAVTIGPGRYTLRRQMSAASAITLMLDPASRASSRLVLPEGLRLEQTVAAAADATDLPKSDFQSVLQDPSKLDLPAWADNHPEGFMFPATYDLSGDESAQQVLRTLVKRFNQGAADVGLEERAAKAGMSPYEVLIVASLLQAEVSPNDFSKVARVIYNRLDAGMPLQLDSTVAYALGVRAYQLTDKQLQTQSPYNTYLRRGLPPRPINSPGEAAIEAALSPAKGKWLYFVAVDPRTQETKFARTYERFLELKAEFRDNLAAFEAEQARASASPSESASDG